MRREFVFGVLVVLCAGFAFGQQTVPPAPAPEAATPSTGQAVDAADSDITAPKLIQTELPVSSPHNCKTLDGDVTMSAIVDAEGTPHALKTIGSFDADIEKLALSLVANEQFKPGTQDGMPAAVRVFIEISVQTCVKRVRNDDGSESNQLTLRAQPQQWLNIRSAPNQGANSVNSDSIPGHVGGNVSAPVLIHHVPAEYSDTARAKHITGSCLVALIIDVNGIPQNVHVIKSLEPSLDQKAVEAVSQYRFKPAMKNGTTPIPVPVTVEVEYRLYR